MADAAVMDVEVEALASGEDSSAVPKKVKHSEEVMAKALGSSASVEGSTSASLDSENINGSNSDLSYHDEENDDEDAVDDEDDGFDYDDNDDYMFDNVDDDNDDYVKMQAQFDNADLPPGVEMSVSWLKVPSPSVNIPTEVSTSTHADAVGSHAKAETGSSSAVVLDPASSKDKAAATSSSAFVAECTDSAQEQEDEVMRKFQHFKRFDTVDDFSDHHYNQAGFQGTHQPSKAWSKKIQDEWKILENDLPDTIFVRVYETRMDLLRAVIVGPAGTPYHDGLFVFDVVFPPNYPEIPPMVYYYSGGLRLNPNLYDCGKVCLSLLNTWTGKGNEKWQPKQSTMLQVLVSIQALILNAEPFFNEPGYESMSNTTEGERKSREYSENAFILSLKTMVYTLRRPPKHFEDLVAGHFRLHARDILSACKAYIGGAAVGSLVNGSVEEDNKAKKNCSNEFKAAVSRMVNGLVSNFSRNGAKDCEEFRI